MNTDTDLLTEHQDLPTNQDGATQAATESANNVVQTSSGEAIDNPPEISEADSNGPSKLNSDETDEQVTGSVSGNSHNSDFIKNEEFKGQEIHLDLTNLTEENKQLRSEVTSLRSEVISLNERLAKLEESAKFKFDSLVKDAIQKDDEVWNEDNEECQKYIAQAKLWHSKTERLCTFVLTAISDCVSRFDQCGDLMQAINQENATLYNSLLDRYKSLELSKKMLERLREPLDLLKKSTLPTEQLLRLQEQDLVDLLRSQTDESEAKKILAKKVKETGDTRYKAVREWRDLAEKSQKQWLNFIEKKLLPALDGINEGKRYAEHLVDELRPSYQTTTCQQKLSDWLQTYVDLENIVFGALKSLDVTQMIVGRGQPVDYNLHEPIGTEPDPNLPHESVKEITRNGYEYKLPDREQSLILRSAQIIVVKNK